MQSPDMFDRVKQEVDIHSKLKHPSILELYKCFQDANFVYLVLELAQNGELHRFLKENQRVSNGLNAEFMPIHFGLILLVLLYRS